MLRRAHQDQRNFSRFDSAILIVADFRRKKPKIRTIFKIAVNIWNSQPVASLKMWMVRKMFVYPMSIAQKPIRILIHMHMHIQTISEWWNCFYDASIQNDSGNQMKKVIKKLLSELKFVLSFFGNFCTIRKYFQVK